MAQTNISQLRLKHIGVDIATTDGEMDMFKLYARDHLRDEWQSVYICGGLEAIKELHKVTSAILNGAEGGVYEDAPAD